LALARAAGCVSCHWDKKRGGQPFAGGLALKTAFGTFHSPNITPDNETGIGKWSDEDFVRALTQGQGVHGQELYPVFPYTSFSAMTVEDALAIKAYLFTLSPVSAPRREDGIAFPFSWRALMKGWKLLFFGGAAPLANDASRDATWNRGRYLVAVGHCGECHTPRNFLGGQVASQALRGNPSGPDGWKVPALAGANAKEFAAWSVEEIAEYLKSGTMPDFDNAQGPMDEVIQDATKHLTDEDRRAIALYLKSLDAPQ
ncbi:MAG: cytochrome c, partial [Alphaproteobacteria bacterium]|nr:cytochrome c [Alphaproteobacteria bacterium]